MATTTGRTKPRQLDDLDRKIMDELRRDGRVSNSAIAARLDVAEGTVRQRTKRLFESNMFRVVGVTNPEVMPDHQVCLVGLNVRESSLLRSTARAVSKLPEVRNVSIVTGRYDFMAEVVVSSNQGLIKFLSDSLASVPGITHSESFLLLETINKWV